MRALKTHFELIPLEMVMKFAAGDPERQEISDQTYRVDNGQRRNQPMSDGALKFPEWQTPLQEVILELDHEKLTEKMQKLETLLSERFQELQRESGSQAEQQALNDALSTLRIIKRDKLGFPDWK